MIELTEQQQSALESQRGEPARVFNPRTRETFVLVPADAYERLKSLLGEDFDPSEAYPAIDRAFAEGWDDPKMDDYDRYEEFKP